MHNCLICNREVSDRDHYRERVKGEEVIGRVHEECYQGLRLVEFEKDGILTSGLTMEAALRTYRKDTPANSPWLPIRRACDRIHEKIKEFERAAWFGGVEPQMKEQKYEGPRWTFERTKDSIQGLALPVRGLSGNHNGIDMLVYTCAGRAMITLRQGDAEITVITAEDEQTDRMGQQGICATEAQAIALLEAGKDWKCFNLKPSTSVGIGI